MEADAEEGGNRTQRRQQGFWGPLNCWYRAFWEAEGRRPQTDELKRWYDECAEKSWGECKPTWDDTRAHSKCLRSLDQVRSYFRHYRAAKKESADGSKPETGASCDGEGVTQSFTQATSLSTYSQQDELIDTDVPLYRAAKVRRPSADSGTGDGGLFSFAGSAAATASTVTSPNSKYSSWTQDLGCSAGAGRSVSASGAYLAPAVTHGPSAGGRSQSNPRASTGSGPAASVDTTAARPVARMAFGDDAAARSTLPAPERNLSEAAPVPIPASAANSKPAWLSPTWLPSPTDYSRSLPASRQPSPTDPNWQTLPPLPPPPAPYLQPLPAGYPPYAHLQHTYYRPHPHPHQAHHLPSPQLPSPIEPMPTWPHAWERPPLPPAQPGSGSAPSGSTLRPYVSMPAPAAGMMFPPAPQHCPPLAKPTGQAAAIAGSAAPAMAAAAASKAAVPGDSVTAAAPSASAQSCPAPLPRAEGSQGQPAAGGGKPTVATSAPSSAGDKGHDQQGHQQQQRLVTRDPTKPQPAAGSLAQPPAPAPSAVPAYPMNPYYPHAPYPLPAPYGPPDPSAYGHAPYGSPYGYPYGMPDPNMAYWGMYHYYYPPPPHHQHPGQYPEVPTGNPDPRLPATQAPTTSAPSAGAAGAAQSAPPQARSGPSLSNSSVRYRPTAAAHQPSASAATSSITTAGTAGAAELRQAPSRTVAAAATQSGFTAVTAAKPPASGAAVPTLSSADDVSLLVESFFNGGQSCKDSGSASAPVLKAPSAGSSGQLHVAPHHGAGSGATDSVISKAAAPNANSGAAARPAAPHAQDIPRPSALCQQAREQAAGAAAAVAALGHAQAQVCPSAANSQALARDPTDDLLPFLSDMAVAGLPYAPHRHQPPPCQDDVALRQNTHPPPAIATAPTPFSAIAAVQHDSAGAAAAVYQSAAPSALPYGRSEGSTPYACDVTVLVTTRDSGANAAAPVKPGAAKHAPLSEANLMSYAGTAGDSPFAFELDSFDLGIGLDMCVSMDSPGCYASGLQLAQQQQRADVRPSAQLGGTPPACKAHIGASRAYGVSGSCPSAAAAMAGAADAMPDGLTGLASFADLPMPDFATLGSDLDLECALFFASPIQAPKAP